MIFTRDRGAPRDQPIDVAVVDYVLADGTSEPLQTALRRKRIPFVMVSGYPRPLVRSETGPGDPAEPGNIR